MSSKINPISIIEQHINTFYDNSTNNRSKWDIFFFFILPLIISLLLVLYFKLFLEKETANSVILCLSIFTPLLFNLILMIHDMTQKEMDRHENPYYVGDFALNMRRLEEMNSNVSFCILISLMTILLLLIYTIAVDDIIVIKMVFNVLIFYFAGLTLLTLLMVLNRINFLISDLFQK